MPFGEPEKVGPYTYGAAESTPAMPVYFPPTEPVAPVGPCPDPRTEVEDTLSMLFGDHWCKKPGEEGSPFSTGGGKGGGGGGAKRAPLTVQLSNPDDIRRVVRQASVKGVGHNPESAFEEALIAEIQREERTAQEKAYAAAESGGTVVEPPSAAALAEKRLREQKPVEYQAHEIGTRVFSDFLNIITGGQGG